MPWENPEEAGELISEEKARRKNCPADRPIKSEEGAFEEAER
jgi:hypothetical protein